ncbi:hypothetical protein RCG17_27440 [Neobacillus sp. PS3-12]|jgi:hypothetical protein|uniref:hypothetical protein n=1 Tax=Neobacillus sp. PS3-12 TaxID=3070677 RepID=UPI0027DF5D0E|nr:hypothetical protein [Neobacillus sp. PS3-12]WML53028.1 hypothetical protein RCG17_27440 [Neobacillus sp. PS3-12]
MFLLTILFYGLLLTYEFIPLYKQKQWRNFWVNSVLALCSFTIALLLTFGINIPSPSEPIKNMVLSLFGGR